MSVMLITVALGVSSIHSKETVHLKFPREKERLLTMAFTAVGEWLILIIIKKAGAQGGMYRTQGIPQYTFGLFFSYLYFLSIFFGWSLTPELIGWSTSVIIPGRTASDELIIAVFWLALMSP